MGEWLDHPGRLAEVGKVASSETSHAIGWMVRVQRHTQMKHAVYCSSNREEQQQEPYRVLCGVADPRGNGDDATNLDAKMMRTWPPSFSSLSFLLH